MENNINILPKTADNAEKVKALDLEIEAISMIDAMNEMAMQLRSQAYIIEAVMRDISRYGKPSDENVLDSISQTIIDPIESVADRLKDMAEAVCDGVILNGRD